MNIFHLCVIFRENINLRFNNKDFLLQKYIKIVAFRRSELLCYQIGNKLPFSTLLFPKYPLLRTFCLNQYE